MKRVLIALLLFMATTTAVAQQLRIAQVFTITANNSAFIGNPQRGGKQVEVTGFDFKPGMTVRLGDVYVADLSAPVRYASGQDSVKGTSPSHAAGWVDVTVTNPDGESATLPRSFLFTPVGDTTGDGEVEALDIVRLVAIIAKGLPDHGNADVNGDTQTTVADVGYLADNLFVGGLAPMFDPPVISLLTASPEVVPMQQSTIITLSTANASSWTMKSLLGNSILPSSGGGSGNATAIYHRNAVDGTDLVLAKASGPKGVTTQALRVRCPGVDILSFTATPSVVQKNGSGATLTFVTIKSTRWVLRSALGNAFDLASGTGEGTFTRTYLPNSFAGNDILILRAEGQCGPVERTLSITVTN